MTNTVDPKGRIYGEELWCQACAMCWDVPEYGTFCPDCGTEGEVSSFEEDADREMGLIP